MQSILFVRFPSFINIFFLLLLLIMVSQSRAQTFGGLSPSIKWSQINTDTCRIIFPDFLLSHAQRMADMIHHMRKNHMEEVGDRSYKIDIVLNNQSTVTNGSVSIAPWKSHFLSTPHPHSYPLSSLPWLDLLSIHEYRHVIQRSTARRGIVDILYYLFGEETWAGASSLAVPNWFYEGDAVWAETELSTQGRGRIPEFMKGYRALALSRRDLTYAQARNGSIKEFVPDHYRLGYLMVSYGNDAYGETFWKDVLEESAAYQGVFYPFSKALKRKTGFSSKGLYAQVLSERNKQWQKLQLDQNTVPVVLPANEPDTYTDYLYPKITEAGDMIYYRRSYERTGTFYHVSNGVEKKLIDKGVSRTTYFGYGNGWLTWTETRTDPRWLETDYSDIILFNVSKGKKRRITRKGKYFSPQPSTDGTQVLAVWQGDDLISKIHIVSAGDDTPVKEITLHDKWVYNFPQWSEDENKIIVAVRNETGEMGIISIDVLTKEYQIIIPFANRLIGALQVNGTKLSYSAYTTPTEQVFVTDLNTLDTKCLTDEVNGAYQAYLYHDQLVYTTFTTRGHRIKRIDALKGTVNSNKLEEIPYQYDMPRQVTAHKFEVKKYRNWHHLLNVHTWGFDYDDPVVSLRALSNNVLNNMEISGGLRYNYDSQLFSPFGQIRLATFYPHISLEASTQNRNTISEGEEVKWRETNLFGGASLNLNLSSGIYTRTLSSVLGLSQIFLDGDMDFTLSSTIGHITFVQKRIQAGKNLFTRNGQYLQLRISESIDDLSARQFLLRSGLSLPGFSINHNLMVLADYKGDLEDADYQFSSGFSQRGLGLIQADRIWRFSANYHMPILYPDWGFAGIVYFYRIRSNLWFEYSVGELEDVRKTYSSTGIELVFDLNVLNETSATFGIRASFPVNTEATGSMFEVFVPVYRF